MDTKRLLGRSMSFPPRIVDGRVAWSEGAENIRESMHIILMTNFGERVYRPAFGTGLRSLLFEPNTVSTHQEMQRQVTRALQRWEPRITLVSVTVTAHPTEPQEAVITIVYRLVATGIQDQMNFQVILGN
jgi:hypothetical protein